MKRVGIVQSSYIPWKGYFDIIHSVDVFIFLEDVQYTVRDWRNRNKIKMPGGDSQWLSTPVLGGRNQLICEAKVDNSQEWSRKHAQALRHSYGQAPFFKDYFPVLEEIYAHPPEFLSALNQVLTRQIADWLGIKTEFVDSTSLQTSGAKDDKLLALIHAVGGDHYLSGPSARDYIVAENFQAAGVGLEYMDYSGYPPYPQISEPFDHYVTILDMLFMLGAEAPSYIWGHREKPMGGESFGTGGADEGVR